MAIAEPAARETKIDLFRRGRGQVTCAWPQQKEELHSKKNEGRGHKRG